MNYLTYPDFDEREPTDTDNPYVIIEHILACREEGLDDQDWHDDYINKILAGLLHGNLDAELGITRGSGADSYSQWEKRHRNLQIIVDAMLLVDKGAILNGVDDDGVFIEMSKSGKYKLKNGKNLTPERIKGIVYDYIKAHP